LTNERARRRLKPRYGSAVRILIATAEGRDFTMHARIAVLKAIG
jgi:hypothetical protein